MKLLITGDIQGRDDVLRRVMEKELDVDYHLNTGDLGIDTKTIQETKMIAVKGNHDLYHDLPTERILVLEGLKVLLTHGHLQNVKYGLENLIEQAKLHQVDMCIFGHTHEAFYQKIDQIIFINPGSLGELREKSYAIYEDGKVSFLNV